MELVIVWGTIGTESSVAYLAEHQTYNPGAWVKLSTPIPYPLGPIPNTWTYVLPPPLWTKWLTGAYENITFPQLLLRVVNN